MWRLGKDGDFRLVGDNEDAWFSHQHYASIIDAGVTNSFLVFDNGNARRNNDDSAHSRGQLFELDQTTATAKVSANIDLGDYALALGSAERLPNGNLHFGLGWMPNARAQMLEYSPSGTLVSQLEADTQIYRALRMPNMYTPLETEWIRQSFGDKGLQP